MDDLNSMYNILISNRRLFWKFKYKITKKSGKTKSIGQRSKIRPNDKRTSTLVSELNKQHVNYQNINISNIVAKKVKNHRV